MTRNTTSFREDLLAARLRLSAAKQQVVELEGRCPHAIIQTGESAKCDVCDHDFGWYCQLSPDHTCHYFTEDGGVVRLITGQTVTCPDGHDPEFETHDRCMYCGNPQERK